MHVSCLGNMIVGRMDVLFCSAQRSECVKCGNGNNLKRKLQQLKLKAERFYSARDDIKDTMNKELREGKSNTCEWQTWLEEVEKIQSKVEGITREIKQDTRFCTVAEIKHVLLDDRVANLMDEISAQLEIYSAWVERNSKIQVPQDGDNPTTSSRMDVDRPEMTIHVPQDKGELMIIDSINDAHMLPIPQGEAKTIHSSRRDDHDRSETSSWLTKRDDKRKYVDKCSVPEATVISEDEMTPTENAKRPVDEQKKARRTRKEIQEGVTLLSAIRRFHFEPKLEAKVMSSKCSGNSQKKITRAKNKGGILSKLKRQVQSGKESETPLLPQVVEGEQVPIPIIKSSKMSEQNTIVSTHIPSNHDLMPGQSNIVRQTSMSSEEHKEEVLTDSSGSLSSDRSRYVIKENMGLTEAPKKEEWLQAHVISLKGNNLTVLPESPNCQCLLKLSLKRNNRLRAIPESFFRYMPMLQVLDLSETRIKSLPSSFMLPSLRVLLLRGCECLAVLPSNVGSLKSLEILDLQGTIIAGIPSEVGQLTRLVTLEMSFHGYDSSDNSAKFPPELIPGGVISKLSQLKDVCVVVDPEDQRWNENVKCVTEELGNLNKLSTLHFYFPESDCLERFLRLSTSWKACSMSKFRFIVGHRVKRLVSRVPDNVELEYEKRDKCLRFVNAKNVPHAVLEVLKCSTALYLDRHFGIRSLSELGIENMNNLEFCIIRECNEMKTVIDGLEEKVEGVLPSLEQLEIHYSKNLTSICKGLVQPGSLIKLKSLALYACPKLTCVFTLSMFHCFSNLEEIRVENCQSLKVLMDEEEKDGDIIVIPRLKRLSLRYLPELVSMGKVVSPWQSLESLHIFNCRNLKSISLDRKSAANIQEIKGEKEWWSALEWEEPAILLQLQPHFITISDDPFSESD